MCAIWSLLYSACPAIACPRSAARNIARKTSDRLLLRSPRTASVVAEADHGVDRDAADDQREVEDEHGSHGPRSARATTSLTRRDHHERRCNRITKRLVEV